MSDCAKAIKDLGNGNGSEEIEQLIHITERNTTQNIYCSDTCKNDIQAIKLEGCRLHQQQQHTPGEINDETNSTITNNIHAISF